MVEIKRGKKLMIAMILCPGADKLLSLAEVAAKQLEKEGFGKITTVDVVGKKEPGSERILLVESGYERSYLEIMEEKKMRVDHHLVLKDLGLDEETEFNTESVELVKDAMIAECAVIESQTPKFNCPCCG